MNSLNIDGLTKYFKDKNIIEIANLVDFYRNVDEQVKSTTIRWRVYSLVQKGILQRVGRGKFRFGKSANYVPEISPKLKSVYNKIIKDFPFSRICVWHTSIFNEAPTQPIGKICTVSIEKMLVDIFCDETLFAAQQGAEMRTMFTEALGKYTVNQTKMLRYADRRKQKNDFNSYLKTISNYWQQT